MKYLRCVLSFVFIISLFTDISAYCGQEKVHQTIRLFIPGQEGKDYLKGADWLKLSVDVKIEMVELARKGALDMGVLMTMPAELYVERLDYMFNTDPRTLRIEVGQAIQGAAIALKDWDDGRPSQDVVKDYLSEP